jgi:hypothetical protein
MYELSCLLNRADIAGGCRVTITFDKPGDTAFFEREVSRELQSEGLYPPSKISSLDELTIYGIRVRVI